MIRYLAIFISLLTGILIYEELETGMIRNYLPDLLWGLALCQTAVLMRENKFHPGFVYTLLILPFFTEAGQLNLFPGTFDWYDLLVYTGLYTTFFYSQIIQLCKRKQKVSSAA